MLEQLEAREDLARPAHEGLEQGELLGREVDLRVAAPGSEARNYGRRASLLSIGVGLTGLITYLYFAIASHELSREQYGQVAVLWSAVFIVVSVLQRPVEQLLSRTVSENLAHDVPIGRTVRVAATIQLAVAVGFDVVALALRTPIQDNLLHGNSTLYWIGVGAITAYGASYFARGFLAGSHRLTIYALLIISESVARTAFPGGRPRNRLGPNRGRNGNRGRPHALADSGPVRLPAALRRRAGGADVGEPPKELPANAA